MSSEREKLADFLTAQLEREDGSGRLVKIACVQIVKGNRLGDELRTITVPDDDKRAGDWADTTAAKILDVATEEAAKLGSGIQRYAVQAWFEGEDHSRARTIFTVAGAEEMGKGALELEGPDLEGQIGQQIRHNEFLQKLLFQANGQHNRELQEENSKLRRENEQLRAEQFKSIDRVRQILLADADRAAADRREAVKTRLIEGSVEKLELFLPHAVNAWSMGKYGKAVFPEAAMQMVTAKTFVDSITDAELKKIEQAIGPEKAALLVKFATSISKMPDEAAAAAGAGRALGGELLGQLETMASNGVVRQ
jgi:hypothetical protein